MFYSIHKYFSYTEIKQNDDLRLKKNCPNNLDNPRGFTSLVVYLHRVIS